MLKRGWGTEINGKLLHQFIPSKTATLVPEFAVEDLPLGRIAAFVPEFAVKDLPFGIVYSIYMRFQSASISEVTGAHDYDGQ